MRVDLCMGGRRFCIQTATVRLQGESGYWIESMKTRGNHCVLIEIKEVKMTTIVVNAQD